MTTRNTPTGHTTHPFEQLLQGMIGRNASDLHLKAGRPPILRIHGQLMPQPDWPALDQAALEKILAYLTDEAQRDAFARDLELDFAYELSSGDRFRVNVVRQQGSIYLMLRAIRRDAPTLAGVIAQRLVVRADGAGRVAACEVMVGVSAVRNLIRESKTPQMVSVMQTGREHGMQTLEQTLQALYRNQQITLEEALTHVADAENFKRLLGMQRSRLFSRRNRIDN